MLAAVIARPRGQSAQLLPQMFLACGNTRRRAEIKLRRKAVHVVVAGIVLQLDVAVLEVVPKAPLARREQHPRSREHACVPAKFYVAFGACCRTSRAGGVLAPVVLQVAVSLRGRLETPIGERLVVRAVQCRGIRQVPDGPRRGERADLALLVRRNAVRCVRPVTAVLLLTGAVPETASGVLHGEEPFEGPPCLVEEIGHAVAGFGDVRVIARWLEIVERLEQP